MNSQTSYLHAKEIATAYLGTAGAKQPDFRTYFNNEYINIFRILPSVGTLLTSVGESRLTRRLKSALRFIP